MSAHNAFIAGIGCRKGASAVDILGALAAAMALHGIGCGALTRLASGVMKADERGLQEAAKHLNLDIVFMNSDMLAACDKRLLSRSALSLRETGSASLSEASALAAAGPSAMLLGPRLALGNATCALARVENAELRP